MQVCYAGTVTGRPVFVTSRHSHHTHELFEVRRDDGARFRVADNVSLAPRIPLAPGDRVVVRGELVRTPGEPLVHWTHRDPRGRHADGSIELRGRVYA